MVLSSLPSGGVQRKLTRSFFIIILMHSVLLLFLFLFLLFFSFLFCITFSEKDALTSLLTRNSYNHAFRSPFLFVPFLPFFFFSFLSSLFFIFLLLFLICFFPVFSKEGSLTSLLVHPSRNRAFSSSSIIVYLSPFFFLLSFLSNVLSFLIFSSFLFLPVFSKDSIHTYMNIPFNFSFLRNSLTHLIYSLARYEERKKKKVLGRVCPGISVECKRGRYFTLL